MAELGIKSVEEAKRAGVKYIVRSSALGADAEPGIRLGRWHREVEKTIESSGIPFTILRPNSFMQNYANMLGHTIRTQSAFYLPMGDGKVSVVDTCDVAAVAATLLTKGGHEGKSYELTGPEALSNDQVAAILSKVAGRKITYVNVSDEDARQGMKDAGMPEWLINALMELYSTNKAGYTAAVSAVVEQVTGKKPISFAQFAKDYADAFK